MRAPAFWQGPRPGWQAIGLWPLSLAYAGVALARFRRPPTFRADKPVICVGNPTVGGAGKTPAAILVGQLMIALGRRPVFLSRGYGGSVGAPLAVDPATHTAREVGDEPLLLARFAPTVVSPDRAAGARLAQGLGDVIVMDDGFQNAGLAKDLSVLVIDGPYGIGNGWCLPAGPLRLPLGAQLERAGAVLIVGDGEGGDAVAVQAAKRGLPLLRGRLEPGRAIAAAIAGRPVIAFAGIGRPRKFFDTLEKVGAKVVEARAFPDHHPYGESDARALMALHKRSGAIPVTTEKDLVRVANAGGGALKALAGAAVALPVTLALEEDSALALRGLLERAIAGR